MSHAVDRGPKQRQNKNWRVSCAVFGGRSIRGPKKRTKVCSRLGGLAPARAKARTIVYSGRSNQSSDGNAMRRSPSCEGRPPRITIWDSGRREVGRGTRAGCRKCKSGRNHRPWFWIPQTFPTGPMRGKSTMQKIPSGDWIRKR